MRQPICLLLVAGALFSTFPLFAQQPQAVPEGYLGHTAPGEGLAPKTRVTEFAKTGRQFEVVFGKGDEVMSGLTDFAIKYHLAGTSHFTAVGAFDKATLGWYDPDKRAFKRIEINQEVEVLAFTGNIVVTNGKPNVHAHVIVALPDGTTRGGHFVEGQISLTMQLFLEELEPLGLAAPNASGISYGHVHMFLADPDAEKKIWVDLLGARATATGALPLMSVSGAMVIASKTRTAPTEGSEGSTVPYVSFATKSYADTKAKLASANVTIVKDDPTGKRLLAEFPEKVRFEFFEDSSIQAPLAFHHVQILSTNPQSLRAWYVKMFSGTEGQRGDALTAVFPGGEIDFVKTSTPGAPTKGRAFDHIGFEITNLEAFCKKLEASGIQFDQKYTEIAQLGGLRISYIVDPEGTRIEMTEGFRGK